MFGETKAFSSFAVDDIGAAETFYGETLGVETTRLPDMGDLLILHLAGGRDTMVYPKPDFTPATYTVLGFAVDEVEAAVDALSERGVAMERYEGFDQDEKGIARNMGPEIAWFTDPAGNILSVVRDQEL